MTSIIKGDDRLETKIINSNIYVCSLAEKSYYENILKPKYLISALSEEEFVNCNYSITFEETNWLKLDFWDIPRESIGIWHGPKKDDMYKVIEFTKNIFDEKETLLIHCQAGISRSTAIAYGILCGKYEPVIALHKLITIRPIARPNIKIVEYFDEIYGMGGLMIDIISKYNTVMKNKYLSEQGGL
jgi:predicted protein tyrosine phosphatase